MKCKKQRDSIDGSSYNNSQLPNGDKYMMWYYNLIVSNALPHYFIV